MDEHLSKPTFFLLSFLSSITKTTGSAKVKISSLCVATRNDERTTRRQVGDLVDLGYLRVERMDSTSYVYRLTEKALVRAPKRPERAKYTTGDCECGAVRVKLARGGSCFPCIRREARKRAYEDLQRSHPAWSKDQILGELMLEKTRRAYKAPVQELEHEQERARRLEERFSDPEAS